MCMQECLNVSLSNTCTHNQTIPGTVIGLLKSQEDRVLSVVVEVRIAGKKNCTSIVNT